MTDCTFAIRSLAPGQTSESLSGRIYDEIDDASFMGPDDDGTFLVEFDRRSTGLPRALSAALAELWGAVPEAAVLRVEEDDLMTIADMARRTGRTAESVRLLVSGRRGPGGFPPAGGCRGARTKVWRCADVALWFETALHEPLPAMADSAFLQAFNDALDIRRLLGRLGESQRRAIASALPPDIVAA